MVIITHMTYPPESAKEIAQRFLGAPQPPEFMTRRGPYISSKLSDGILAISIYELDDARLAEGFDWIGNYLAAFFGVPGFKYDYNAFYPAEKALKIIGLG